MGDMPAQAGQFLHDNLCPHVKKVLDRVLSGDVPELAGAILMNSCDAMRRLADAWRTQKRSRCSPPAARRLSGMTCAPATGSLPGRWKTGRLAQDTLAAAQACGAAGVIGHTVKFCDPYLARMPIFREEFKTAGMPLLLLEGDCTLRSIGQQRTRIEAFIEMLYRLS